MRILSLTRDYPKANSLRSRHETLYACVDCPQSTADAIRLPRGEFPIARLLSRLPNGWQPDCIHISSTLGVFTQPPVIPTGVGRLDCPSVMKLTDSHFRHRPIQSLIEYANRVGCQYHWTAYDRHHLHFFKEAGLSNPFWVPGAFSIQPYAANVSQHKLYEVLFCGANSLQIHPRRATLLAALQKAGVKLTVTRKSYTDSLDAYTAAKIVFNCSLNGDLNRRVFEVLMAGGFLLTDRLAPESGLPELFQEGVHLECYGSKQELLEKVNYYLAHPAHADRIAQQGHEHFMKHYHPFQLEEQFLNIVVKGQSIPDQLLATKDDRTQRPVQS
ncbi:MAG TPA: glycosyltransferase, partial [Leptolyngbya sp.]|nr:glycosyltransferase [Leptolyngbya sp.]